MATSATPTLGAIKTAIRLRHLQQLQSLTLVSDPLENFPVFATYEDLVGWTNDNLDYIKIAIKNRVYGGPVGSALDYKNAFMAFMESAAMYLRDTTKVVEAVKLYRSGNNTEGALRLLESSTANIDKLAEMWGMEFIQICDLVTRHPDGHSWLVGPFCGAFVPKDISGNSPFIGVAFKGTNVTAEIINDLISMITTKASGRLWDSQVAYGFYYPLFSTYDSARMSMPFVLVQQAVQDIVVKTTTSAVAHVTGHSLGGAYSSLSYAQLCIEGFGTMSASLGDLYTFGSPRVGRSDFVVPFKTATQPPADYGESWRIVNHNDYVPKVPASLPWPVTRDPFIHVDSGMQIYPDQNPTAMDTEIGTHPTFTLPTAIAPHFVTEYYMSLRRALTGKTMTGQALAKLQAMAWGRYPLSVSPNQDLPKSFDASKTDGFWYRSTAKIAYQVQKCVVATIAVGRDHRFVGEITGLPTSGSPKVGTYAWPDNSEFRAMSLEKLYAAENKCILKEYNGGTRLYFVVDDAVVAYVEAPPDVVSTGLTRGTCVWTFGADATSVHDIVQHDLDDISYRVFGTSSKAGKQLMAKGVLKEGQGIVNP